MKTMETASNLQTNGCSRLSLAGVIVCLMLAGAPGCARASDESAAPTPREIVKHLQDLRYPKEIAAAQPLCTGPGWYILVRMTADKHDFFRNFKIGQVKANKDLVDIQLVRDTADGKSVFWVRLLDVDGVWKLNNVKVEKFNDYNVNLWVQYIYRHPEVIQQKFAANPEADIQRFNAVTTGIGNVLDIILKLRALSEHRG